MPFEIVTYLASDQTPEQLLDALCRSDDFHRKGPEALGLGAIVEADYPDPEEASHVMATLGLEPGSYLRFIVLRDAPQEAIGRVTLAAAGFLAECGMDGAIVYPMGEVVMLRLNGVVALSDARRYLQSGLSEVLSSNVDFLQLASL